MKFNIWRTPKQKRDTTHKEHINSQARERYHRRLDENSHLPDTLDTDQEVQPDSSAETADLSGQLKTSSLI